jgi:heterodisulfide reductase subunit A
LDTRALCQLAANLPGVVYANHESYPCSKDGRERLIQAIREHDIERIMVAGCAPRLVGRLFEETLESADLEHSYLDIRNIREQCAYVHMDQPDAAYEKAANLIEMGAARLGELIPPHIYRGPIARSVLIIGSSLSGLTAAITLARLGIPVILAEHTGSLGGSLHKLQAGAEQLIEESIRLVSELDRIQVLLEARISDLAGQPGDYRVTISRGEQASVHRVGAIIVATSVRPKNLDGGQWYDRTRVKTQLEYAAELDTLASSAAKFDLNEIVMVLYEGDQDAGHHTALNCMTSIYQAITTKELNPEANVTILFRELYLDALGNRGEEAFLQAKESGVTFFRYQQGFPPVISDASVDLHDELTGETMRIPYERAVLATALIPQENCDSLAVFMRLPQDEAGFIIKPRIRLRPGNYADDGVFVLGGAHHPVDTSQALFQAYLTSVRVLRFLEQERVQIEAPCAEIQPSLCTGCGNCVQVCPRSAIRLEKRDGILSLSEVDKLRCTGCGNCVVVCPVKAIQMPGWNDAAILAQISAALAPRSSAGPRAAPRVVALVCEWSAFAAADLAGARRCAYPPEVRLIRMNCSARFDPNHILWAFLSGADGVFLGTCYPGECHYGTGNLYAKERAQALKAQMAEHGINPHHLRLEFFSGDEGFKFAEAIGRFVEEITAGAPG